MTWYLLQGSNSKKTEIDVIEISDLKKRKLAHKPESLPENNGKLKMQKAASATNPPTVTPKTGKTGVGLGAEGKRQRARLQHLNRQIAHFGQLKRLSDALAAFRRITTEGLTLSAHSYASLINAHVRSGDIAGASPRRPAYSSPRPDKPCTWFGGAAARLPAWQAPPQPCRRWRPTGCSRAWWPTQPCSRCHVPRKRIRAVCGDSQHLPAPPSPLGPEVSPRAAAPLRRTQPRAAAGGLQGHCTAGDLGAAAALLEEMQARTPHKSRFLPRAASMAAGPVPPQARPSPVHPNPATHTF